MSQPIVTKFYMLLDDIYFCRFRIPKPTITESEYT